MRTIFAEYNPQRNSIDVYTSAGYMTVGKLRRIYNPHPDQSVH